MNKNETQSTPLTLIDIDHLEKSPQNVRRTVAGEGLEELKASILSHGLMQNLVVTADGGGRFFVIAGARRLEALRALKGEGKLPAGFAVPCQVVADRDAVEMSLAENTARLAMHPADEFEAFAELAAGGKTAAEVAQRFGVEERHVRQRLKLGRVAPELLAEYRAGNLDLDCLMAFTITDDHARQLKVYRSLQGWQRGSASHIRRLLTEMMVEANEKLARFVGLDAYQAAGGTTRADLFGEEVYLEDPELLHRLAGERLEGIRRTLEAEGWGWVVVSPERDHGFVARCARIRPVPLEAPAELLAVKARAEAELHALEEAQESGESGADDADGRFEAAQAALDLVEERLASHVAFDPDEMKAAGCYVSIGHDGRPTVERGLMRKEDRKRLANAGAGGAPEGGGPKEEHSEALRRDLAAYRLQVAQAEIARQPEVAFDLLVFHVASGLLGLRPPLDGPNATFTPSRPAPSVGAQTLAVGRLEEIDKALPTAWLKPAREAERFALFRQLADGEKRDLLAYCTAVTLRPKLAAAGAREATAYDVALSLTGASVADSWRPTKENYLGRVSREKLLEVGRDLFGKAWADSRRIEKKGALADELHEAFSAPEKHGKTPEEVEKLERWLPQGMAFGGVTEAKKRKAKRARKAV